jgi:outer membrane protein
MPIRVSLKEQDRKMSRTSTLRCGFGVCCFVWILGVTTHATAGSNLPAPSASPAPDSLTPVVSVPATPAPTHPATSTQATTARPANEPTSPATALAPSTMTLAAAAFERVTLDQAIERALRRNPSAQAAALEIDRAEALVRQARAASLPSLSANATYTRLDSDRLFGTRRVAAKDQLNANVVLTVPLIVPGKWVQWSHAKDDAKVLELSSNELRRQLAITVARTFLAVLSQRRVVDVNERALETAVAHESYAAERLAGGIGRRIDAVRAAQQVSTTRTSVERARIALARSMEALGVLLGEERPIDVAVDPELGLTPDVQAAARDSSLRLDVQVARGRRDAAERKFRDSWIDFLPQLTGQFQPFYQTPASLTMPTTGWQTMLVLTLPLYDGGARYGASDERRVLRDEAEFQVTGLLRQARSEVRIAFEAQRSAEKSLAAARDAAQLAHQAQDMSVLAYKAGASTNLEVIDAERQARDTDTEVTVAEDALRQARLDLLIASGRFPRGR